MLFKIELKICYELSATVEASKCLSSSLFYQFSGEFYNQELRLYFPAAWAIITMMTVVGRAGLRAYWRIMGTNPYRTANCSPIDLNMNEALLHCTKMN